MNPWLIAGLVFGVIGLIQEAVGMDDKNKSKVVKPKETKALPNKAGDTIVNVGGQTTKVPAAKTDKKPADKPKEQKPSDG